MKSYGVGYGRIVEEDGRWSVFFKSEKEPRATNLSQNQARKMCKKITDEAMADEAKKRDEFSAGAKEASAEDYKAKKRDEISARVAYIENTRDNLWV